MANAPGPMAVQQQPLRATWPFVAVVYATLVVWMPVAVVSGGVRHALSPYFVLLDYAWGLIPVVALVAAVGMIATERVNASRSSAARSTLPYVAMMLVAVLGTVLNINGGILSTDGVEDVYSISGDDAGYDELASGLGTNYFWDQQAPIQIACLACTVIALAGAIACAAIRANSNARRSSSIAATAPIGRTPDGRPIYPVVGYTPDGTPITADRAVGFTNPRTNSLAIVALVLGLVFPLAAIPVGHISMSQIRRTGEQGNGLAIAGLVLGYLGLASTIALIIVIASNA